MDAYANFAISNIATAPTPAASGTTASVTTGQGSRFPTPPFNAVIWPTGTTPTIANAEIVRVTAMSGDNITVMTRTQESTSARTVLVGDIIAAPLTKKTLTDIITALVPAGGSAGYVLMKNTGTDYDYSWQNPSLSSGGSGAPGMFWVAASDAPTAVKTAVTNAGGTVCTGTNDHNAINTALTFYKYVQLTQGTYNLGGTILPGAGQRLEGSGSGNTFLKAATGLTGSFISITGGDHITLRDFGLNGNAIGTVNGIDANITSNAGFTTGNDACLVMENLVLRNITGIGVSLQGTYNRDSKIRNVHVWNSVGKGWYINCPDGSLEQCIAGTNGNHGFHLDTGSSNWRLVNCKAWFSVGDGFLIAGARNRLDGCEAQDNQWAGFRINGSMIALNGVTADSNSWKSGNANANVHSGIEVGRTWDGTTASTSGGFDCSITNVMSWDKNESSRGRAQRSGIRVRTGARGVAIVGFTTGDPASTHFNVTAGIEWDTPTDQTVNYATGISHRVSISDSATAPSRTVTGATTLALSDIGQVIEVNSATGVTITIPTNATVAFPVGTLIELFQLGVGQITVAGASGVTLRTSATLTARAQYSTIGLRKRATDEWVVSGDLT